MDDAFGYWFSGFVDGEGHFSVQRQQRATYVGHAISFQLKVRRDDRDIIEKINEELGYGWLCFPARRNEGGSKPQIGWGVTSGEDCLALVELLERYPLRSKKARDFVIWSEAVRYFVGVKRYRGGLGGPADWSKMEEYAVALSTGRVYNEYDASDACWIAL